MNMKLRFNFRRQIATAIAIFLMSIGLNGQTIVDIEVDKIYIYQGQIVFYNEGEINEYVCGIVPIKQNDYLNKLIMQCEIDDIDIKDNKIIDDEELLQFSKISEIKNWVKNRKFANDKNKLDSKYNSFFQLYNDYFFVDLKYENKYDSSPFPKFQQAQFLRYVYVRINNQYLIIGLLDEDSRIIGYVIPSKNGGYIAKEDTFTFEDEKRVDSINLTNYIKFESFFRIKKEMGLFHFYDKLFNEKIIDKAFDKIRFMTNYIVCSNKKEIVIYDKALRNLHLKNIKAAFDSLGTIHCIIDNKIRWLDQLGKFHDTFPNPNWGLCGNFTITKRNIVQERGNIKEIEESENFPSIFIKESTLIAKDKIVDSLKFLNNKSSHIYNDYSKLNEVFSFPYNTYIINTKSTSKIVNINNKNENIKRSLIYMRNDSLRNKINVDSINNLILNFKDDIEITTLFEGDIEAFGYYHPIRYKENNLYGYYPQNKKAKYAKLEKFNFFYAEFELPNGKKGWLDIYGNEYYQD